MKRINLFKTIILLFLVFSFCQKTKRKLETPNNFLKENKELFMIIDSFTNQVRCAGLKGNYPSNHVYFRPYKDDTIMTIACYHTLSKSDFWWNNNLMEDSWWLNFLKKDKNMKYYETSPDGIFWYTKRKPFIFFNTELYKPNFKKYLKKDIPDSLKGQNFNAIYHDSKEWYYLYKNGKFIKIELKKDSVWKDKPYYIVK